MEKLYDYNSQSSDKKKRESEYSLMYEKWCKIWEKSFEKEFWGRIVENNEILPSFHPIDKRTFIILCTLHLKKCGCETHGFGICGFNCGETEEKHFEKQEKYLLLMRLMDMLEETKEDVIGNARMEIYKPTCYAMAWGQTPVEEFAEKLKKNFPAYEFSTTNNAILF